MPKRLPRYSRDSVLKVQGSCRGMCCCGLNEFSGMYLISTPEDAMAVRRGAHKQTGAGTVLVTTIKRRSGRVVADDDTDTKAPVLMAAGFKSVKSFVNPNSGNRVTLWQASTIKHDRFEIKE